ncbi:MAG: DUF4105 domain-containing protein [Planctomycetota bacterium]
MLVLALLLSLLQPASPRDDAPVLLLTISPGELAWERFGHNALVVDGVAYDWGRFDFGNSTGEVAAFVGRFIQGDMEYGFGAADAELLTDFYVNELGREVTVTALALTPAQKNALRSLLTAEPATYQYDYFTDNCSTKLRDLLDQSTDGALAEGMTERTSTYRTEVDRHTEGSWWLWPALAAGMGTRCDEPITAWEQSFIPGELDRHLDQITIDGRPIVTWRRMVGTPTVLAAATPPNRLPLMGLIGVIGAVTLVATSRWVIGRFLTGCTFAFFGLGGCIVLYLWLFTGHDHAGPNASGLLLAPVSLLLGIAMPMRRPTLKQVLAGGVLLCIMGGLAFMVIAGQHAWPVAAAAVPPQLAGLWIATRTPPPKTLNTTDDHDPSQDEGSDRNTRPRTR